MYFLSLQYFLYIFQYLKYTQENVVSSHKYKQYNIVSIFIPKDRRIICNLINV